jgi:hypothetical protein
MPIDFGDGASREGRRQIGVIPQAKDEGCASEHSVCELTVSVIMTPELGRLPRNQFGGRDAEEKLSDATKTVVDHAIEECVVRRSIAQRGPLPCGLVPLENVLLRKKVSAENDRVDASGSTLRRHSLGDRTHPGLTEAIHGGVSEGRKDRAARSRFPRGQSVKSISRFARRHNKELASRVGNLTIVRGSEGFLIVDLPRSIIILTDFPTSCCLISRIPADC